MNVTVMFPLLLLFVPYFVWLYTKGGAAASNIAWINKEKSAITNHSMSCWDDDNQYASKDQGLLGSFHSTKTAHNRVLV